MDNRGAFGPDENHSLNNPTRIKLVSNKPKVYLLFIKGNAHVIWLEGIYSSRDNAESEVEVGEEFAIVEMEVDSLFNKKQLNFSIMEKSE